MPSEKPTTPIRVAQNTEGAQRLLAAQSRLYSDAKRIHSLRLLTVAILCLITIITALVLTDARTIVGATGGAVTFLWSVFGGSSEKRSRMQAAAIQEEFDTYVFDMEWNNLAADRPSPMVIASAAQRYRGNRTRDWYPKTDPVQRPLDILICQRSNLGWGSSTHRNYAYLLLVVSSSVVFGGIGVAVVINLSVSDALTSLLVPLLGPSRELIEMIRNNFDSAETKSKTEAKLHSFWQRGLMYPNGLTLEDCRSAQDQILKIRQTNAYVPDWFDNLYRTKSEDLMQQSASHLVEQAVERGRTL